MTPRSFLTLGLLAVLLLVSCAPAAVPAPAEPEAPAQTAPTENEPPVPTPIEPTAALPEAAPPTEVQPAEALPTEVPPTEAAPAFVSRGPNLEATDPTTVVLASGDLQLVEFFRFT